MHFNHSRKAFDSVENNIVLQKIILFLSFLFHFLLVLFVFHQFASKGFPGDHPTLFIVSACESAFNELAGFMNSHNLNNHSVPFSKVLTTLWFHFDVVLLRRTMYQNDSIWWVCCKQLRRYISSLLPRAELFTGNEKSFLDQELTQTLFYEDMFTLNNHYYDCWWLGDTRITYLSNWFASYIFVHYIILLVWCKTVCADIWYTECKCMVILIVILSNTVSLPLSRRTSCREHQHVGHMYTCSDCVW